MLCTCTEGVILGRGSSPCPRSPLGLGGDLVGLEGWPPPGPGLAPPLAHDVGF